MNRHEMPLLRAPLRRAASDLDTRVTDRQPSPFLGAPTVLVLERTIDGEVPADEFETNVVEITPTGVIVERNGKREELPAEGVFLMTGYHPDAELMRHAGIRCDDVTLVPEMNPDTFETNVPNLFLAGGCVAGRNTGWIFIENGRFHGGRIVKLLSGRLRPDSAMPGM